MTKIPEILLCLENILKAFKTFEHIRRVIRIIENIQGKHTTTQIPNIQFSKMFYNS